MKIGQLFSEVKNCLILVLSPVLMVAAIGCSDHAQEDPVTSDINVLLISIDTLRRDKMGLYGYNHDTTPHLNNFAMDAVVFDHAVKTSGGTLPVHMSMLTSLHPLVHRVSPDAGNTLAASRNTLAEVLSEAGYRTAAFTDGGWVRGKFGFDQGFDRFDDEGGHFKTILPKAYQWLKEGAGKKFFLFLHTYDVHSGTEMLPYDGPEERYNRLYADLTASDFDGCIDDLCASRLLRTVNERILNEGLDPYEVIPGEGVSYMIDFYDGSINYVDDELDLLFEYLRRLGAYDNTLVLITSDHGEEFLEHGFFLHRQGIYDEVARVPLIIKFPFSKIADTRFQGLVSTLDLMPTVLDCLGLQTPAEANGASFLRQLQGAHEEREAAVIASALRTKKWKLIAGSNELFDLESDPGETVNVIDQNPERAQMLKDIWRQRVTELRALSSELTNRDQAQAAGKVELTQDEAEELRALGYAE